MSGEIMFQRVGANDWPLRCAYLEEVRKACRTRFESWELEFQEIMLEGGKEISACTGSCLLQVLNEILNRILGWPFKKPIQAKPLIAKANKRIFSAAWYTLPPIQVPVRRCQRFCGCARRCYRRVRKPRPGAVACSL
jgi:hypothetical protein